MYDIAQNDKLTNDNEGKIEYDCLFTVTMLYLFGRTKGNNKVLERRKTASRDGFEHTHPQLRHISTDYFHRATAPRARASSLSTLYDHTQTRHTR
jgi:hypothetical protein